MEVTKKFLNEPSECVDESIHGLVLGNPGLRVSENCRRVVLRSEQKSKGKVALVAGGGSGHEPFAAGFVGSGFLDAAVCGDVFASPPSDHVLSALNSVANPAGVIVFVINYTGDRLNFGLALQRFTESPKSDLVFIADDVALESKSERSTVGRRGLAGAVLVLKIAGAMAEAGADFERIVETSRLINDNCGTMGVSLYPCSLPGKPPMFELASDKMEMGLGIHGEPGCEKSDAKTAKEVVACITKKVVESVKLRLQKKDKVVLLLNNLGRTTVMEMNILQKEVIQSIQSYDLEIVRFYAGTFMTSLDGHGFSVTILKVVDEEWLEYLDAASDCCGWRQQSGPFVERSISPSGECQKAQKFERKEKGVRVSQDVANTINKGLRNVCEDMKEKYVELNRLDGLCGDGDCGDTLLSGATAIERALDKNELDCEHPEELLLQLSQIFEKVVGGTSGAIYALMLSSASAAFKESFGASQLQEALKLGLAAIQKYGHARPGDRTMVDPLHAAVEESKSPAHSWESILEAAEKAAKETAKMEAMAGRASYTSSESQREADAGAMAVVFWMRALFQPMA